ncbi:MAG: dihydrofolate reductase [Candidatus Levybacteria bacterium]|nr:dihydrofolate reductase [Candidatus Levybacteria bacterium]
MISIIAAIDSKRGLGKNNDLLFKIPQDFERMKKITTGHPLVMGRKTFESIGRKLPGRTSIVVTRDANSLKGLAYQPDVIVASLEDGIEAAKSAPGNDEVIIFGGGQIFTEAVEKDLVDVLHLTVVEGDYNADTFFPDYSKYDKVLSEEKGESNEYRFTFLDLTKS